MNDQGQRINVIEEWDDLQNDRRCPAPDERIDPEQASDALVWATEACERIRAWRYRPVLFTDATLSRVRNAISNIAERVERVADYAWSLGETAHSPLYSVLSEVYWHLLGERRSIERANHFARRAERGVDEVDPYVLEEGAGLAQLAIAERYFDGVGVDVDRAQAHSLMFEGDSPSDECKSDFEKAERWRIYARAGFDDPGLAKRALKLLVAKGYLSAATDLALILERNDIPLIEREPVSVDDQIQAETPETEDRQLPKIKKNRRGEATTESLLNKELEQLNGMVGLAGVKAQVKQLVDDERVQAMRRSQGLIRTGASSRHLVLTGNPGTGKTTVARILSRIFYLLGTLEEDVFIEVDRGGLVAGFVGKTAEKTGEVIDSALGGVLFIDEAYTLNNDGGGYDDTFGLEAINTLLKAMEDQRDKLVVIVAGYTGKMEHFMDSNPGLRSRFNTTIHFDDYVADDMIAILDGLSRPDDYALDKTALAVAKNVFLQLKESEKGSKELEGNGRFVRNFYGRCQDAHTNRIASMVNEGRHPTKRDLAQITADDVALAAETYGVSGALNFANHDMVLGSGNEPAGDLPLLEPLGIWHGLGIFE
ncbi:MULTISPECIES: AAA family ATPase [Rhodanobacter]|uniref:AAA family ATPase n=1 Tax=Rhodanobacter TaxID=75309 RepID=UPI0016396DE8|nr:MULTISPECIES: AAA family ATPase [Rhodanobacter]UJJ55207.1 AAA family ATPase [Rhodanobacter thiooxydans]